MLRISRIKIRNFKSFKFIDIPFPSSFIALAGPNGSGKSNVIDAVRFCTGETALRSLRARKVRDLIFAGADTAEVTLYFDGDEKYEVQRAIRKDGKIRYRLNGRTVKRYTIQAALQRHNLDESGRNIIAQGEVQRIIQMSGKERRTIIDSVAGIADFEQKKKEALGELEVVNTRIKDVNLVMGERLAFLKELEQERQRALQYQETHTRAKSARASLLKLELATYRQNLAALETRDLQLRQSLGSRQAELNQTEQSIRRLDEERGAISQELQSMQQTAGAIQKIEQWRASVSSKKQSLEDYEVLRAKYVQELSVLQKEIGNEKTELIRLEKEIHALHQEVQRAQEKIGALPGASDSPTTALETRLSEAQAHLQSVRERIISIESEMKAKEEILRFRQAGLATLESELSAVPEARSIRTEIDELGSHKTEIAVQLDASFTQTKETNARLAQIDKDLLELREKAALLRVRVSPSFSNPALQYLAQWKQKEPGIYGTLAELIEFKPELAAAVEAAAGARLLYMVVEDSALATRLISRLKTQCEGRVTFIPLRDIRVSQAPAIKGYDTLARHLRFGPKVKAAAEFVFGTTLLVDDMKTAQSLRSHGVRMVTKDGELFEPSGIITGGRVKTSLLAATQLKNLDAEIESLKGEKEDALSVLMLIREEESRLRARKADKELEIKTLQIRSQQALSDMEKRKALTGRQDSFQQEIRELQNGQLMRGKEKKKLESDLEGAQAKAVQLKSELEALRTASAQTKDDEQRKREELLSQHSFLKASLAGRQNELELRKQASFSQQEKARSIDAEIKELGAKAKSLQKELALHQDELQAAEARLRKKSQEIEKLFGQLKALETQLQQLGETRGKKKYESDQLAKEGNDLEVKLGITRTKLEDLANEYAPYQEIPVLDMPRDQLVRTLQESETLLQSLGNVNFAAIEMYEKKKQELGEIEQKIGTLGSEREAILKMMGEIEEHKRSAFFETFDAVSENFQKMFAHLAIGQGILYLDKPNDPFESGLHIKLRRGSKEHSLDSLSGGENSLIALMFIFALQFFKPAPFYMLDEVDAALDKPNSQNLSRLVAGMARGTQFLVVTHNDILMASADSLLGVTKMDGVSRIVGVKLAGNGGAGGAMATVGPASA